MPQFKSISLSIINFCEISLRCFHHIDEHINLSPFPKIISLIKKNELTIQKKYFARRFANLYLRIRYLCRLMIQRIQSIFLVLAAGLGIAALFLPLSHFYSGFKFPVDVPSLTKDYPFMVAGGLVKIAALISLIALFLYKKRKRQINVVRISQVLLVVLIGFAIYMFYPFEGLKDTSKIMENTQQYITKYWAFWMPLAMLLFNALAIRFIKKDDQLVRSSERLR